jgi:2-C-methyl-D-erythritol 4-phosphate cytidylyltransferase/2-C-methyl-D-erythritol 2,4-cyclodiphosphate synthase
MKHAALIVAGGRGLRAGGGIPKQYQILGGVPLLRHALLACLRHAAIGHVQVVIHSDDQELYHNAIRNLPAAEKLAAACFGGDNRQDSVRLGLEALNSLPQPPATVLIHDAARPFLKPDAIDRLLTVLGQTPGAILAVPVVDTLKRGNGQGQIQGGADRSGLWRAQTPQAFHFSAILDAHRAAAGLNLTDDAAVAEQAGLAVQLVAGGEDNFKVTAAEDFARAERQLMQSLGDIRNGQGYDVHAFGDEPGRPLMLAGIAVPHSRSLAGHSDADVGLHALTDALLGALAEGDIGQHFPPSDARWKGAASDRFLAHAADLVRARGGIIAHLDLTFICEAPKIGPHRDAMRARIAAICSVDIGRVAVKATTTEGLGFTGRREGIAAQAMATIRLPL